MQAFLIKALLAVAACLTGFSGPVMAQSAEPIAIIVHPTNPLRDLSVDELRRLYLGNTTIFENRERVILLESTDQRGRFYRSALGMGEDRLKRHWVSRVFAGNAGSPPREVRSEEELRRYVATHPGAIAFLRGLPEDTTVRLVTVDGRHPRDANYPIR